MILVDANVPMYLVGAAHPNKDAAVRHVERLVSDRAALVTDAEVLQEILHRYVAIDRRDAIQPAFDAVLGLVERVIDVDLEVVRTAKDVVQGQPGLSARDALHVAVMRHHGIDRILSFDRGFDQVPGVQRIG